jgi:hypothetical protein
MRLIYSVSITTAVRRKQIFESVNSDSNLTAGSAELKSLGTGTLFQQPGKMLPQRGTVALKAPRSGILSCGAYHPGATSIHVSKMNNIGGFIMSKVGMPCGIVDLDL